MRDNTQDLRLILEEGGFVESGTNIFEKGIVVDNELFKLRFFLQYEEMDLKNIIYFKFSIDLVSDDIELCKAFIKYSEQLAKNRRKILDYFHDYHIGSDGFILTCHSSVLKIEDRNIKLYLYENNIYERRADIPK